MFCLIPKCPLFLPFVTVYPYFVDITKTVSGHERIEFGGYSYGRRVKASKSTRLAWVCTRNFNKKRCMATIETDIVGGYVKMRYKNNHHSCIIAQQNIIALD